MTQKDQNLFQQQFSDIQKLTSNNTREHDPSPKNNLNKVHRQQAAVEFNQADNSNYLSDAEIELVAPEAVLEYVKPGVQNGVYKKLRLGKYEIQDCLDLHRKTVKQSRVLVWQFLHSSQQKGYRTILIIHGKGENSLTPAKLKSYIRYWLHQHQSVLAFHSAIPRHGGTGSTYVLLQKSPQQKQQTRELHQ